MSRQDQSVGAEGKGYQARGNLTVNNGLTPDQMAEVMFALAKQLRSFVAEAHDMAESRMKELRESLICEFAKPTTLGKSEAFADPDYQFVVQEAHKSYARSGEEGLRQELVKLLVQRSTEPTGSRTALLLNRAIANTSNLTPEDYAALCAVFLFKHCRVKENFSEAAISELKQLISSFIHDLPIENYAYDYLQSLGLIAVNQFSGCPFDQMLHQFFDPALTLGFSLAQLNEAVGDVGFARKLWPALHPVVEQLGIGLRFNVPSKTELNALVQRVGIEEDAAQRVLELFEQSLMPAWQVEVKLIGDVPDLMKVKALWNSTNLQQATLTALGKVLAHSALTSRSSFQGLLETWVR